MKLTIFILGENSQSRTETSWIKLRRPDLVNRSLVSMKILKQAVLIPDSKSFGYTTKDVVKEQYNNCMMKGKYEVICELICSKTSDHGTDLESGNKCDTCRGRIQLDHLKEVIHKILCELYISYTCMSYT